MKIRPTISDQCDLQCEKNQKAHEGHGMEMYD
jgi:hypothetical protein